LIPKRARWRSTNRCFKAAVLGSGWAKGRPLDDIAAYINATALFRNSGSSAQDPVDWKDGERRGVQGPYPPTLGMTDQGHVGRTLVRLVDPRGYFPVNRGGQRPGCGRKDTAPPKAFGSNFPSQRKEPWQSIADLFRPVATGEADYAAFQW